jgi:hypothetical protein
VFSDAGLTLMPGMPISVTRVTQLTNGKNADDGFCWYFLITPFT